MLTQALFVTNDVKPYEYISLANVQIEIVPTLDIDLFSRRYEYGRTHKILIIFQSKSEIVIIHSKLLKQIVYRGSQDYISIIDEDKFLELLSIYHHCSSFFFSRIDLGFQGFDTVIVLKQGDIIPEEIDCVYEIKYNNLSELISSALTIFNRISKLEPILFVSNLLIKYNNEIFLINPSDTDHVKKGEIFKLDLQKLEYIKKWNNLESDRYKNFREISRK